MGPLGRGDAPSLGSCLLQRETKVRPALGVVGESQNTKLGACILCRWSERLQEAAMGQAGLREKLPYIKQISRELKG